MKLLSLFALSCLFVVRVISQDLETGLAERLQHHVIVLASDSMEGRGLGTAGKELAKNYIAGEFRRIGLLPLFDTGYFQVIDLKIGQARVPATNIGGYLEGSDTALQGEFIVIGAHYDHLGYDVKNNEKEIFHGADDNASGVAAVIELARYFAANPGLARRSIIFLAFDAEESGLLGSNEFIRKDTAFDVTACRVMFSIDMIGMYSANKGLDMKGIGALDNGESLAETVAARQGIILKNMSGDIENGTDTWPFGEKGIPAIHLYTGKNSPYHKPGDTSDKLDYDGMARVVDFMQALLPEISANRELVPSRYFTRMHKPFAFRFNAGVTAGIGSSRQQYRGEYYNAKSVVAFNAGLFAQVDIGKWITLQPSVLYETDGSKSADGVFRRQSVCVPLDLHINIVNEYSGMYKFYPFAGGYFKYSFAGRNGGKDVDFDNEYRDREWGLDFGLGLDMMKVQAKLTWRQSLSEISRDNPIDIYSATWFFSLGYKF